MSILPSLAYRLNITSIKMPAGLQEYVGKPLLKPQRKADGQQGTKPSWKTITQFWAAKGRQALDETVGQQ